MSEIRALVAKLSSLLAKMEEGCSRKENQASVSNEIVALMIRSTAQLESLVDCCLNAIHKVNVLSYFVEIQL
jgi:hypothetical protein